MMKRGLKLSGIMMMFIMPFALFAPNSPYILKGKLGQLQIFCRYQYYPIIVGRFY